MPRRLWLGSFWLLGATLALAQGRMPTQQSASAPRPLTVREGQTIVNAAWQRERQTGRRPDCSHLVHEVYTLAGYPYPYADSFELYAGAHGFIRMAKPQPGDLVVWRGHVGIVVDPAERSFYSSVTSGLRTEIYDAPEWKSRGPARFYRYVPATRANLTLTSGRLPGIAKQPARVSEPPAEEPGGNSSDTAEATTKNAASATPAAADLESPPSEPDVEVPSSIRVASSREKPTEAEVAEAISELNNGTGNILREEDLSRLNRKVIVYDSLSIEHTEFRGNRGSAQARIKSSVILLGASMERKPEYERFRWELRRSNGGWDVLAPKDRVYVPRDIAVGILAARLASLTQDSGASGADSSFRQQAQIVHALSALFEEGR